MQDLHRLPLTEVEKLILDDTTEEIIEAIKALKPNKCPGLDGLPANFFKKYCGRLAPFLTELYTETLYTEILWEKQMHLSARRGVITLLEKSGHDSRYLTNWRPLSLLNTDYKILSKILATRLGTVLPRLIHPMQTGFMKNRSIAENRVQLTNIIYHCKSKKIASIIMSFDFEKAFDTIEWSAMEQLLNHLNFGPYFISAVKTLYTDIFSTIMNNGYWSDWFPLSRPCRQGCCFSPLFFNLIIEVLGDKICNNTNIRGIVINLVEIKGAQYADDVVSPDI